MSVMTSDVNFVSRCCGSSTQMLYSAICFITKQVTVDC
jgi:hypothetical protein